MEKANFADRLAALTSAEAAAAKADPERLGELVERLASALGFSVAIACRGDPASIDRMLAGIEGYTHAEAVEKAPLVRLMFLRPSPPPS